jgi:citrate synthase
MEEIMKETSPPESILKNSALEYRPGLEGVKACRSSISSVDGAKGVLEYRGINIRDLALNSNFEETAYLLLYNHLPSEREFSQFKMLMAKLHHLPGAVRDAIANFPVGMHHMLALQSAIALLQGDDFYADDISNPQHNLRRAVSLIAKVPTIIAAFERHRHGEAPLPPVSKYSHAGNFLFMLTGEPPDSVAAKILDRSLILHAEHSMNNSTFVARVIGSTNASIYSSISGACGSLSGNLHGGANERVLRMIYSIGHPDNVEEFVDEMLASNTRIMGIGHRVYKVKDPRAQILQGLIPELIETRSGEEVKNLYKTALKLEEVVTEKLGDRKLYPNVDFYSGIVLEALGIPIDLFTSIFAMARAAGWSAHWLEQITVNRLFRPAQEYIGDHNRPYVPMNKR